jgi:hypothetical protein
VLSWPVGHSTRRLLIRPPGRRTVTGAALYLLLNSCLDFLSRAGRQRVTNDGRRVEGPAFLFTERGDIMARSSRWPFVRMQAWNRDKKRRAVCHICGEPIDYFLPPSSGPDAYEPDHLIPVHMRPDLELDLSNIAPSHRRCNRQRGDGTNGTNTIGERSRVW